MTEITITRDQAEELEDRTDSSLREDYSGRGMDGRNCPGFTFESRSDIARFWIEACDVLGRDTALMLARRGREDSMGHGVIVYFPSLTITED